MLRMFIFYNSPIIRSALGEITVQFTKNENEYQDALLNVDYTLSRGQFYGNTPTADRGEEYVKRADRDGPVEGGNDFVFVNAYCAPKQSGTPKHV